MSKRKLSADIKTRVSISDFVFNAKLHVYGMILSYKHIFFVKNRLNNVQGDVTDVSE